MKKYLLQRAEQLLLTIWVGSLLAIGYLAAPVLFYTLDDRQLAGELAGHMFHIVNLIGLVCGLSLLLLAFIQNRPSYLRQWRHYTLLMMLGLIIIAMYVLQPQMAAIKGQIAWQEVVELKAAFGKLHGISSILYMLTSLMGIVLVVMGVNRESTSS